MSNRKFLIRATIFDRRGKILSTGENSYEKTSPVQYKYACKAQQPTKIYLHAEIAALVKLRSSKPPYKIFIERYDSLGNPKLAAPCSVCQLAIKASGIKRIKYTVG